MNTRSAARRTRSSTGRLSGVPSREPQTVAGRASRTPVHRQDKVVVMMQQRPTKIRRTMTEVQDSEVDEAETNSSQEPVRSRSSRTRVPAKRATSRTGAATSREPLKGKGVALPDEDAPKPKIQRTVPSGSGPSQNDTVKPKKTGRDVEQESQSLKRKRDQYEDDLAELEKSKAKLNKRERSLKKREEQLESSSAKLSKRDEAVSQREKEANELFTTLGADRAGEALAKLDDDFTCALCFDVMACPYSLVPSQCGHTFCALCLLKWFFSHLHYECGAWHTALECPLCRAHLPFPPDPDLEEIFPRPISTCPFTPNRLADKIIAELVDSVRQYAPPATGSSVAGSSNSSRKKKSKAVATSMNAAAAWGEGGESVADWQARDRKGRAEMSLITKDWCKLDTTNFRAFKVRLGL